jgi:hypothetical protein
MRAMFAHTGSGIMQRMTSRMEEPNAAIPDNSDEPADNASNSPGTESDDNATETGTKQVSVIMAINWNVYAFPKFGLPDLSPFQSMGSLTERVRESLPPNWSDNVIYCENLETVIRDDGIPLVWVPRSEIVTELLAATDRLARVAVLLARCDEIVEDCRLILTDISHQTLAAQRPLAMKAVNAFAGGHYEAAQALAVVVTETAVAHQFPNANYAATKKQVNFDLAQARLTKIRVEAALTPIAPFYTAWKPSSGIPAPEELSRHVSVHQADVGHYTKSNATVAILLVTSVLRALQEMRGQTDPTQAE